MPQLTGGSTIGKPKKPKPPPSPKSGAKGGKGGDISEKDFTAGTASGSSTNQVKGKKGVGDKGGTGNITEDQPVSVGGPKATKGGNKDKGDGGGGKETTDAGSVRTGGKKVKPPTFGGGDSGRTGNVAPPTFGHGGGGGNFGPRRFGGDRGGLPQTNDGRPNGFDRGYEDGLDFGGGGGTATGGGGGGGAAGSNPLSATAIAAEKFKLAEGQSVEDVVQAQGAKKTRKQRRRESTY